MKDFNGRIAVVTGGGTGMGRELVRQLAAEGAHVAMCDVFADNMAETKRLSESDGLPQGVRITTHVVDVADEIQLNRFAAEVAEQHDTQKIHLLFNNAGIGGGASFVNAPREEWDRVFDICWNGVYLSCRAFLPSAAKFAVKGFTEALITDFRNNAPHLKAHIVMPGGVGTPIGLNSRRILVGDVPLSEREQAEMRKRFAAMGIAGAQTMNEAQLLETQKEMLERFEALAPTTAKAAAKIILDGVKAERWRILVGEDVTRLDQRVRRNPEAAYDVDFAAYAPFSAEERDTLG